MFSKLAAKNVGRSVKDYGVWFLTIVFAVCLFYVFNALETQAVFQYLGWWAWGWGCWRPGACPPSPPGCSPCP